jgi:hypothetical protein
LGAVSIWTSLPEETNLILALQATGRLATTQVGTSAGGTPILVWRIGGDTSGPPDLDQQAVLLFIGGQHGDEPAGREALLALADYLCNTTDTGETEFLDAHGVLMMPTCNPDGTPNSRTNADGQDVNRWHLSLDGAPETNAIAQVLGRARPCLVTDHHEFGPGFASEDVLFAEPRHPAAHSSIVATSEAVIAAMETRAAAESLTFADYPFDGPSHSTAQQLVANCGLRHAAAALIETRESADDDPGQQDRVDIHYAMAEEILAYAVANSTALLDGHQTAAEAKAAEGAAGVAPYNTGEFTIDPPPLGYRITGVIPHAPVQAFNVDILAGGVVSMAQSAQPVIPLLFDEGIDIAPGSGSRLFTLVSPAVVASVVEFAEVVHGSHQPTFEARVLTSFQNGPDPAGTNVPILGGDVQFDATANVFASMQLTTAGIDEQLTGESRFPRMPTDLLAPYGNEIWARRGVDVGDAVLWSPLGYFRIDSAEQADAPYGELSISGQDRMAGLIDARLVTTRSFAPNTSVASVFAVMIGEVYPQATIVFDDDTGFADIDRRVMFEEDRYAPLAELAQAFGKIMYWDGEGVLRIESAPDESVPLWEVKAGTDGVLVSAGRRVNREGVFNGVVARGEGGDQQDPVFAAAVDIGPNSPTRWGGRFGKVPRFYASPFIKTEAQALSTARAMLRRRLGAPHSADFGTVANPALRPWHPIRVTQRDGNREIHVVQSVTIPLNADGTMSGTTRERTQVLIGRVTS